MARSFRRLVSIVPNNPGIAQKQLKSKADSRMSRGC